MPLKPYIVITWGANINIYIIYIYIRKKTITNVIVKERKENAVNGKGDKTRVTNFTRYRKNYTKIFKNWVETRTELGKIEKKEKVEKKQ